jgi:methanogenic corrinoid protein MtbC1
MRIMRQPYLTLLKQTPPMTEQEMYAYIFYHLADKVADAKKEARELMRQYLERGFDPADMSADYTLAELDLAEEVHAGDYTGNTFFVYTDVDD